MNPTRPNTYIVYNTKTMQVIKTFWGCMDAYPYAESLPDAKCINRTHPINKEILNQLKGIK